MNIPVQAYQHALCQWQAFNASTSSPGHGDCLWQCETRAPEEISRLLRLLPGGERRPVAFGVFFKVAGHWSPLEQTVFLGEFLSGPSLLERRLLEAAARGALHCPEKLPVTVDEFPSRIWQRAQASQAPARLVAAACLAVNAMACLLDGYADEPLNLTPDLSKLQPGESMAFHVPAGDLPAELDLVALTPTPLRELKLRVLARLEADILAETLPLLSEMFPSMSAWTLPDDHPERASMIDRITLEASASAGQYQRNPSIYHHHHTRRLGRFMVRLGQRGLAIRCAKAIGFAPWERGWQHQGQQLPTHREHPLQYRHYLHPFRRHPCRIRQDRRHHHLTPMKAKILRTEDDYQAALARVESLMDAKPGSAKEEELDLWSLLVERYEQDHFPIDLPDPVEAIKFRMEQEGLRQKDLANILPGKNRVSEVLSRKRPLSLGMIRSLHEHLHIPAEVLIGTP